MNPGLWRVAELIVPPAEIEWIAAMRSEASLSQPGSERFRWFAGALTSAVRLRIAAHDANLAAGFLIALMIAIDWSRGDAGFAILFIAASSVMLVWRKPEQITRATLIAGGMLPLAHAVANFNPSLWPYYQCQRLGGFDWMVLISLFLPAYAAARAGSHWRHHQVGT